MKFKANRNDLVSALSLATKVSKDKSPMEVLSKVAFVVSNGTLQLSTTNLSVEEKISFPVSVQEDGSFAVNAKSIYNMIKSMYSDTVEFSLDEKFWVRFKCGKVKAKLAASSIEEFPDFSSCDDVDTIFISGEKLKLLMRMTDFCICKDEGRPHLNSLLLSMGNDTITTVGTDGHKLSKYTLPMEGVPTADYQISAAGLGVLNSLVVMRGEELSLGRSGNKIFVQREVSLSAAQGEMIEQTMKVSLVIREHEGKFAPYEKVIPTSFDKQCIVNRHEFYSALKRAMLIAGTGDQHFVNLQFNGTELKISGEDVTVGEIDDVVSVEFDSDQEFTIGFNGEYLLEMVSALSDSKDILLYFNGPREACKITSPDEIEYYIGVIMPIGR